MPDQRNTITGRSAFLSVLKAEGVTHMFGNPGTTELPIMHALTAEPDLTYVLGLQESVAIFIADGYARASGELVACNVHVAPGLGNAMGAIYTAMNGGTPMIVTAGQQEQGHGLMEPLLYGPLVDMAKPNVKWSVEVTRLEDLPRILHRAAKIAMTAPTGPVFISLPGDILNSDAPLDLGKGTRVDTASRPNDAALAAFADRLLAAERPVIVAGTEIVNSDAFDIAGEFASALGAAVYQQTVPSGAHFPSEHPAYMGGLSRIQPQVLKVMSDYDMLICLGSDVLRMSVYDPVEPLPEGMPVLQIGLNDWEMGKNYPAEIALKADLRVTLEALIPVLRERGGAALAAKAESRLGALRDNNWSAKREKLLQKLRSGEAGTPMNPDWVMARLAHHLPENAIIVDEAITSGRSLNNLVPYTDRYSYFGNVSGGIGWGIGAAVGVQLAQPDRRVVAVIGDGSAMYSIQALWTAANCKLPITFIIANNGGYRIIKQRLKAFHGNDQFIGMDFKEPSIDFAAMARSMGLNAERIETGEALDDALARTFAGDRPTLLEVVVDGSV